MTAGRPGSTTVRGDLPTEGHDFHGDGELRGEAMDQLGVVDHDDQAFACSRYDFFAQQRAAVTFDEMQSQFVDLVGAVNGQVDLRVPGKVGERIPNSRA